ncbi:hypothetical protein TrLO_g4760 [Triparma laevis f. longispina]|uniref:RING-type domain-containing protein n=1 Tax=Triparma laevis f. longispina TaxID=1714387 RepID=A0A9W6ZT65_9STRA|nr:hypothetical protein TrLO_g4760 [Triparma laevis f. longispina]
MKSSQSPPITAASAKPAPYCAFPNCKTEHCRWHKKICVAPQKGPAALSGPPAPPVSLKGSFEEEEDDEDKCIICLDNIVNAKLRPCGHSATCRECTDELMKRAEPCPLCRKPISGRDVGKWQSSIGEHGLWPTSSKNLSELASGEGFNEYFQKQFNGIEASYLRSKEVLDVLEIENTRDVGPDLPLERQVLTITKSEDLVKLRALTKLCSREFFDDPSLLVVAWRRILEVLVLGVPPVVEKKIRGKKKKQQKKKADPMKLEILDACFALGKACGLVGDNDDMRQYFKRAKEGYEEQLGPDDALEVSYNLIKSTCSNGGELIEKFRDLVKRCEKALGEENEVTLETLSGLGGHLCSNGEKEEAIKDYERCLAGQEKVFGGDYKAR